MAGVAAATLKANRAKACQLMPCHSTEMDDPPRADVVVSETLGNYALEENIIDTLADARLRHLKDGGVIIPARIRQFVAPVISDRIHRELTVWDDVGFGIDLSAARAMSLNNVYVRSFAVRPTCWTGGAARQGVGHGRRSARDTRATRKGEARWKLDAAATIYGFAYWWEAELVAGRDAFDGARRAAHALGAALFPAAGADDASRPAKASSLRCGRARRRKRARISAGRPCTSTARAPPRRGRRWISTRAGFPES